MIKILVKQNTPLQFSTNLFCMIHWGLENLHTSYQAKTPKMQKCCLLVGEQELHSGWSELHSSEYTKYFIKSKQHELFLYISAVHLNSHGHPYNPLSENMLPHTLPFYQGNMSRLTVCCTDHTSSIAGSIWSLWHTKSSSMSKGAVVIVNTTVPQQIFEEQNISFVVILLITIMHQSCKLGF